MKITKNRLKQIILEEVKRFAEENNVVPSGSSALMVEYPTSELVPTRYLYQQDYFKPILKKYLTKAQKMRLPIKRTWNVNDGVYIWLDEKGSPHTNVKTADESWANPRDPLPDWAEEQTRNSALPVPRASTAEGDPEGTYYNV